MDGKSTASERAVEDILAQSPELLIEVIDFLEEKPRLVERQQSLAIGGGETGRSDLVYLVGNDVLLIELKVVTAKQDHIDQLEEYVNSYQSGVDGTEFAQDRTLVPILLAPEIPKSIQKESEPREIRTAEYDIGTVFDKFQESLFSELAQFQVRGLVTSVAGISLLHGFLRYLYKKDQPVTISEAAENYDAIGKGESSSPESRVQNFRKTAQNLDLVTTVDEGLILTDRGVMYIENGDVESSPWRVTSDQSDVIVDLLYQEPFNSDLTFSLLALLQSVFELSKNSHPVPRNRIEDWYANKVGKRENWGERTRRDVVRWLGTYLEELGLISVVDREFYLTPRGFDLLSYFAIDEGRAMLRSRDRRIEATNQGSLD